MDRSTVCRKRNLRTVVCTYCRDCLFPCCGFVFFLRSDLLCGGSHENGLGLSSLEIGYITVLSPHPRGFVRYVALTVIYPPLWDCEQFSVFLFIYALFPFEK